MENVVNQSVIDYCLVIKSEATMCNVLIPSHFHSTVAEAGNQELEPGSGNLKPSCLSQGRRVCYNNKRNTINFNYLMAF